MTKHWVSQVVISLGFRAVWHRTLFIKSWYNSTKLENIGDFLFAIFYDKWEYWDILVIDTLRPKCINFSCNQYV